MPVPLLLAQRSRVDLTVTRGKRGDFVVLNPDPSRNLHTTTKRRLAVKYGKVYAPNPTH